jgi:hypothetical protein
MKCKAGAIVLGDWTLHTFRIRQRAARSVSIRRQAQIEFALPARQPLPRRGLQQLHPGVVAGRAQVADLA